jgi:FG-GAP-like repeat
MGPRLVILSLLTAAATGAMVMAGPALLVQAPGSPLSMGGGPSNVAIGDVNSDSRPDLVVIGRQRRVAILLGLGDGRFSLTRGTTDVPENPSELALGDVNGDGNLDLALASHESYNVILLLGDGRGRFQIAPGSPIVMKDGREPHTHGLGIADFNGDGKADLITVNSNDDNDIAVMLGNGQGRFTRAHGSPFAVGPGPYPLALGDLDVDGNLDAAITSTGLQSGPGSPAPGDRLTLLFGNGQGGFRRSDIPLKTGHTWFAAIGDVNGDRQPDLVTTHIDAQSASLLLGDGRGNFAEAGGSPFEIGAKAFYVALVDLNRDGHADMVAAADTGVRVLIGDGRGGFTPAPGSPFATGKGTWKLAVADVNADGKSDVAASNLESDSVTVLLGRLSNRRLQPTARVSS